MSADEGGPSGIRFRRPRPEDHPRLVGVVDEWWGGRRMRMLLPRLWLELFGGTSWLAEREDGRLAGFLVACISQDDPAIAYCHMLASDPNLRRSGIASQLYERFFEDARRGGATSVRAITWPGDRVAVAFHRAMGFAVDEGPGTKVLYGTPAHPDHDGEGDDRVLFSRSV